MAKAITYKTYTIKSLPLQLGQQWHPEITIIWTDSGALTMRKFSPDRTHRTEIEADLHGINYAQSVIDGTVPGQSVS